jgi:hypothetical protein
MMNLLQAALGLTVLVLLSALVGLPWILLYIKHVGVDYAW